jgi:hypothetical protein
MGINKLERFFSFASFSRFVAHLWVSTDQLIWSDNTLNKIELLILWIKLADSTLGVRMLVNVLQLHSSQKQPNLKLKSWPKQLLGFFLLALELPGVRLG